MKITQRCSCGATFEIEGPEVHVGFRANEWLDAHACCRIRDAVISAPLPGCGFANVPLSHGVAINSSSVAPVTGPRVVCYKCGAVNAMHEAHCTTVQQSASLPVVPWNGGYAIRPTAEAANAFWKYWRENGETHKHGYYESTWGAINAALRAAPSPAKTEGKV